MQPPNPDRIIVAAFDAVLAVPQGNGIPLPRLLLGFERARQAGFVALGLSLAGTGMFGAALLYGGLAASLAIGCPEEASRLDADARGWSPRRAALYRTLARHGIENGLWGRIVALAALCLSAGLLVGETWGGSLEAVVITAALSLLALANAAHGYAACAMPRDPDAPAPRVATAGA